MTDTGKRYDPKAIEDKWYAEWLRRGSFHGEASKGGDPYCIVIPPPNVTGILHMGHALNTTIQDVLIRWKQMAGRNTVWVPGTDHAGIATQNVVERALRQEGVSRHDLGRDAFIERVWSWRQEYGQTITNQLKKLGSACDWERERFTMDGGLSDAVTEVFLRLYEKDLIYRGNYIINWCPRCHTALSDEESEHQDTAGKLYHLRYPVEGSDAHIVVATTRPETMLGDVAVAVHPSDERYQHLEGRTIVLPLLDRPLRVIFDEYVDKSFGTGLVKVTPAHDPNDFDMGNRHALEPINVMDGEGTMNEEAGPYAGMDRFACRKQVMTDLEALGLVEKVEDHDHAVGHCYRCDTVVEPRLSKQWFVRMKPLAEPAIEAVKDGRVEFVPDRWNTVYLNWMENIRDWCISRQIWWGHRIPVFYCDHCDHEWAAKEAPSACPSCGQTAIRQDEDVLDTWFSSWLWPFSVFGWPEKSEDLDFYYPTNELVTASEIIFFWVARMIMAGFEFMGDLPFRKVYIHGTVRDDAGRKMSKSLGNSIDPLDIIEQYSADALRFSLIMLTATGQDVYVSSDKFEIGRNFGTKIWNAVRFIQMHMDKHPGGAGTAELAVFDPADLSDDDKHILAKLDRAVADAEAHLEAFRFNDYAKTLYEFVWHQFCDRYVEYAKPALYGDDTARCRVVLDVMNHVLHSSVRLLHPLMPFLTEELWEKLGYNGELDSIMKAPWPVASGGEALGIAAADVAFVDKRYELTSAARTLKADYRIDPARKLDYAVKPRDAESQARLEASLDALAAALGASSLSVDLDYQPPAAATPRVLTPLGTVFMSLEGAVDVEKELVRLQEQQEELGRHMRNVENKLANPKFVEKAPTDVVQVQRDRQVDLKQKLQKLGDMIATLSATEA